MSEAAAAAAADVVGDMLATDAQEAPEEAEGQETEAEFNLEPEIPDELASLMDEPDIEDEPTYQEPQDDYQVEAEEYEDPAVTAERNKRIALEKKLKWLEEQKLSSDRKRWVEKDGPFFPYADAEGIAARCSSRKEFAREAKRENERIKKLPGVKKMMEQMRAQQITDEWGSPTAGPGPVPASAIESKEKLEAARRTGNLKNVVGALFETGKIKSF